MYEPFDVSAIVTKLRLDLEHLFQASNQLYYIGHAWPTAEWLALQVENRLHYCINDLSGIIMELSKLPPVVQVWGFGEVSLSEYGPFREKSAHENLELFRYLSIAESMELANIGYTRQCLVEAWKVAENRKRELLDLARQRKKTQG